MDPRVLAGFFDELEKLGYTLKSSIPNPLKMPRLAAPVNPQTKVTGILTKKPKNPAGAVIDAPQVKVPIAS